MVSVSNASVLLPIVNVHMVTVVLKVYILQYYEDMKIL